jgi:hypothetical protein
VKKRVESSGASLIPVTLQFFYHCESIDRLVSGMQQYVDSDKTVEKFLSVTVHRIQYTAVHFTLA